MGKRHFVLYARKAIEVGEEITISYLRNIGGSTEERRARIEKQCRVICRCHTCEDEITTEPLQEMDFRVPSHNSLETDTGKGYKVPLMRLRFLLDQEFARLSSVDAWYECLQEDLNEVKTTMSSIMKSYMELNLPRERMADGLKESLLQVKECLQDNNKFNLTQDVIEKNSRRICLRMYLEERNKLEIELDRQEAEIASQEAEIDAATRELHLQDEM